jgi:hypothetical protein
MLVGEKVPDATDLGPSPDGRPRRPYWPIALLMLGVVLALLGAAFVLDERLRPRVGPETGTVATPQSQAAALPTATPPPPTATTVPVAAAPVASPTLAATATAAPTAPNALATASALPSRAADLFTPIEREVIDAYLRYWDVRIKAYYNADPALLSQVMSGAELAREESQIRELAAQQRAAILDVEHDFRIVKALPDEAVIYDEYVNRSRLVDGATKRPLPETSGEIVEKVSYEFRRINGTWKVVDGQRHD